MKTVACIIARTNSKRLPQKVLKEVVGKRMIEHLIARIKKANLIDKIYLCTSQHPDDSILLEIAYKNNIESYAGSEDSVIDRMLDVAKKEIADNVIRITGDNIFCDSVYIDLMLKYHNQNKSDYTRTEYLPIGITAEILSVKALKNIYQNIDPNYSEYLMIYAFDPNKYNCTVLLPPIEQRHPDWTLTVDTPEDWGRVEALFNQSKDELSYQKIIELIKNGNIPNYQSDSTSIIKFPAGISLNFEAFRKEIELRILNSQSILISQEEYNLTYEKQI